MARSLDDPALLFTPPPRSPLMEVVEDSDGRESANPSHADNGTPLRRVARALPYVLLPILSAAEKSAYKAMEIELVGSDEDPDEKEVVEFVGEHRLGTDRFIYARYRDGIIRRKVAREFKASHPEFYADYEKKKEQGTLKPFNLSSSLIRPSDRVNLMINIDKAKLKPQPTNTRLKKGVKQTPGKHVSDSDIHDESDQVFSSGSSDDESDAEEVRAWRRPMRKTQLSKLKKPDPRQPHFSPKKTRAGTRTKAARVNYNEGESDDDEEEPDPVRRTSGRVTGVGTRGKKSKYADSEGDSEDEISDSTEEDATIKPKLKTRPQAIRPAYGRIRRVVDLSGSDSDTAPLRVHRDTCERCRKEPAHKLLYKFRKKKCKTRKGHDDEDDSSDGEDYLENLGGWVRCMKCCVAAHWRCLANHQKSEILQAARERSKDEDKLDAIPPKRLNVDFTEKTEFICSSCSKGGVCLVCREVAVQPERPAALKMTDSVDTAQVQVQNDSSFTAMEGVEVTTSAAPAQDSETLPIDTGVKQLLFRCLTCKRLAHYEHLAVEGAPDLSMLEVATHFQQAQNWKCSDCASYKHTLEHILAWRPFPLDAVEPPRSTDEPTNHKANLPREYLVKWAEKSYRRTQWVPHMWLLSSHGAKLKNFLTSGPKVFLDDKRASADIPQKDDVPSFAIEEDSSRGVSANPDTPATSGDYLLAPIPDAETRIPARWKVVDRVLDVLLWHPDQSPTRKKKQQLKGKTSKRKGRLPPLGDESEVDQLASNSEDAMSPEAEAEYRAAFEKGEEPSRRHTETIEDYEDRTGQSLCMDDIDKVVWIFAKWDELGYDEATWDSPPTPGSLGHAEYVDAFRRLLASRLVKVPKRGKNANADLRCKYSKWSPSAVGIPKTGKYDIGQDSKLSLMDFQVTGVNWLCSNWWNLQQCILADEMGLGKTVQIVTFLGLLVKKCSAFPALVVVPNSTITNWVREFARWAPHLRVVPFFGVSKARDVIKEYELSHNDPSPGTTGDKFHVLVTTYDTITSSKEFNVFRKTPRWEVLVVDEGQRLKSDASLLFKRLRELRTAHRIIMTGTPLNNNIRELFNLMNFLDPLEWKDLETLEAEYEELNDELIQQLHERLRPYFLRRVKADVLKLPPKNEVIVPVSMAPLQKEIYKSILSQNLNVLRSLTSGTTSKSNSPGIVRANINNMLMQLRKCLQHPYLISNEIEPKGLSDEEAHSKLIDASAKLRFLKLLLPKLKARGHRVLLFSQFVIALNIIEDFLQGEGYKFFRLDGNSKQADRQAGMDEFNKEGSDVFIYILSTRAGGVGINLWSADTVIIFDPDFNPHQDLQAIARAHRFGQKKTCLVFKLMVKDSAEDRIMQTGKKKLALDHLIVQKMDEDEGQVADVQSILTFGAKALFDESADQAARDIVYNEIDVEKLIEKTEIEGGEQDEAEKKNNHFAFAKVWDAHRDSLDELEETEEQGDPSDSWAQTLAKVAEKSATAKVVELSGRGVRRKAALVTTAYYEGSPQKPKAKGRSSTSGVSSDVSDFLPEPAAALEESDNETDGDVDMRDELNEISKGVNKEGVDNNPPKKRAKTRVKKRPLSPIQNQPQQTPTTDLEFCGLCKLIHGPGVCGMTQRSEHLVVYRQLLLMTDAHEAWEDREAAIRSIDTTLLKRGHIHLIQGQLLHNASNRTTAPVKSKKPRLFEGSEDYQPAGSTAAGPSKNPLPKAVPPKPGMPTSDLNVPHAGIEKPYVNAHQGTSTMPSGSSSRNLSREPDPRHNKSTTHDFLNEEAQGQAQKSAMKRASSPGLGTSSDAPKRKKSSTVRCIICGKSPFHLAKECPVILEGPKSTMKAITRLTAEGQSSDIIAILTGILRSQRKREASAASTFPPAPN